MATWQLILSRREAGGEMRKLKKDLEAEKDEFGSYFIPHSLDLCFELVFCVSGVLPSLVDDFSFLGFDMAFQLVFKASGTR